MHYMSEETQQDVKPSGDMDVKGVISHFTIFKLSGTNRDSNSKVDMGLFPFAGMVSAFFSLILLAILYLIDDFVQADGAPFTAVLVVSVPFFVYGFNNVQGLMNICDRMFPTKKNNGSIGPAAIMIPVMVLMFMYGIYWMFGTGFMLVYIPALEIAVTLAVVSALYFSKERKDVRYTDCVGTPGFIKAILIAVIAGVVFSSVPDALIWGLELMDLFRVAMMFVFALAVGFICAKVVDKKLNGISDSEFGAIASVSRPLIAMLFVILMIIS